MKILVLNPNLYSGEGRKLPKVESIKDTMIYNLCLGFKKLGHQVTLGADSAFMPTRKESYDFEVLWHKSLYLLPPPIQFSKELWHYLNKNKDKFDLVITSELFSFPSLFASILCPEKTLVWHELALHQRKFHKIPAKTWYNVIARLFERKSLVVGRSKHAIKFIRQYHSYTADECVEHGINLERFKAQKEKDNSFVVVSQLIQRKNIPSIIKKFKKLIEREQYKDYKLYIIGRGPLEDDLRHYAEELGCKDSVVFPGFMAHAEMQKYVGRAKALLIDTKQDNNMVSIPETIACGTPVVTNTIPTNSYMINDNGLGIVKDGWDDNDLIELINHSEEYTQRCIDYHDKLGSEYAAARLVELFLKYKK